jgi:enoyl-CoA hydratase/carnithine racemase
MARELAKISLNSYGWYKDLFTDSFHTTFVTQIERERTGISNCGVRPDGQEGLKAFAEK